MNEELCLSVSRYFSGIQFLVATERSGIAERTGLAML